MVRVLAIDERDAAVDQLRVAMVAYAVVDGERFHHGPRRTQVPGDDAIQPERVLDPTPLFFAYRTAGSGKS